MLHLEPTPEPDPQLSKPEPRVNGHADPALVVSLPLSVWQRVAAQLGEGSVNQFLPVLTAIQRQLQDQLQPPRTEA
jgi:hypothetical protein